MSSSLLEIDPLVIANQLTRLEIGLFKRTTPEEFIMRIFPHAPMGNADNITPIINLSGMVSKIILILVLYGCLTALDILDCIMGGRMYLGTRGCQGTREGPGALHYCCGCRFIPSYEHYLQG